MNKVFGNLAEGRIGSFYWRPWYRSQGDKDGDKVA